NTSFTRVIGYDEVEYRVADRDFVHAQAVLFDLTWPQVSTGDGDLLVRRVAIEPDDFHTVEQRAGYRFRHVRGRDEENMRQVQFDTQIVILKRMVLCRIQHFEQRG